MTTFCVLVCRRAVNSCIGMASNRVANTRNAVSSTWIYRKAITATSYERKTKKVILNSWQFIQTLNSIHDTILSHYTHLAHSCARICRLMPGRRSTYSLRLLWCYTVLLLRIWSFGLALNSSHTRYLFPHSCTPYFGCWLLPIIWIIKVLYTLHQAQTVLGPYFSHAN